MTGIKVLAVASEIYPLVKTGGLADVAGALPLALRKHGVETITLVPGYRAVKTALGAKGPRLTGARSPKSRRSSARAARSSTAT